jgi:glycosyltransferase involved in cell wall biosynthesis
VSGRRITLVADELRGIQGGGLGTVFTYLAIALARLGNSVDVLYFGRAPAAVESAWAETYDRWKVGVHVLPPSTAEVEPPYFARLLDIASALEDAGPDVVIAQDLVGAAYIPLRRRQLGLGFENTLFIVRCSGTRRWITDAARKVRVHPEALAVTVLEQAALELADAVVAESRYMVDWMEAEGWRLPDETHVVPSVLEWGATGETAPQPKVNGDTRARRVVFFGRLEERKGVRPFIEAVNALEPEVVEGLELEFLGPDTPAWPAERVRRLLAQSAFGSIALTTGLDRDAALAHLREPGTLAVMPSLEDNSPSTVYECLSLGIPFIASALGGTAELVVEADRERALFEPTPIGIEQALRRALVEGVRPARPAFDDESSLHRWAQLVAQRPAPTRTSCDRGRVDVLITERGAREEAVRNANAPWIVMLAPSDVPQDGFLEILTRAQAASGADVVTCGVIVGSASHLFLGEPGGLGVVSNAYGTVALIRRSLLLDLPQAAWASERDPDWPLLAHLSARGARIASVPMPLVSRPRPPGDVLTAPADALLAVAALEHNLPGPTESLARLAAGLAASAFVERKGPVQERRWLSRMRMRMRVASD